MKTQVRLLGAFACFAFLISVFFPFLQAVWQGITIPEMGPRLMTFWSFKGTIDSTIFRGGRRVYEYWFSNYWFPDINYRYEEPGQQIGPALILTLASQILVLLFSSLAIILDKSQLFLYSLIFNVSTLLGMCQVTFAMYYEYARWPVAGFWLTLYAIALFATTFFMSRDRDPAHAKSSRLRRFRDL